MNTTERLSRILTQVASLAQGAGCGPEALASRELAMRVVAGEWLVLLLGETSSGKSSMANGILDDDVLPATSDPTTAAVVEIRICEDIQEPMFCSIGTDGIVLSVSRSEFQQLCRNPGDAKKLCIRWPMALARNGLDARVLRGLVLIDAPGYNSCVEQHNEVLTNILPEADAVVSLLNFQRGFTPEDRYFLELLNKISPETAEVSLFAANRLPPTGGDRQIQSISNGLRLLFPRAQLHRLSVVSGAGRARLWSESLWAALSARARAPERQTNVERRSVQLARLLLERVARTLSLRWRVIETHEDHLDRIRKAIEEIELGRDKGIAAIDNCEKEAAESVLATRDRSRDRIWNDIDGKIEDANRFLDANSCGAYIRGHVLPHRIREWEAEVITLLQDKSEELGILLDGLVLKADRIEATAVDLPDKAMEERLRDALAAKGIDAAAKAVFMRYLETMGGAFGPKAGFVNLAKHLTSRASKLVDMPLGRGIYDEMGVVLKKLGLNAGRATSIIGAVVVEVVAYIYQVARWKKKLRSAIQLVLGLTPDEPLEDILARRIREVLRKGGESMMPLDNYADRSIRAFHEAMDATRRTVEDNIGRRADVLRDALEKRGSMGPQERDQLALMMSDVQRLAGEMARLQEDMS